MELMGGFEPPTSPLPRVCSTPELHEPIIANPSDLIDSRSLESTLEPSPYLERAAGIEPASSAWKAEVLPLNYARLREFVLEPSLLLGRLHLTV